MFLGTDARHGFEEDSYVSFQDVKGMTELNGKEFQIKVTSKSSFFDSFQTITMSFFSGPFTFTIGDTSQFGEYIGGGTVTELKMKETVKFVSCSSSRGSLGSSFSL